MPVKYTKAHAIKALKEESTYDKDAPEEKKQEWSEKIAAIDTLPDWYLIMLWYDTYTEILKILPAKRGIRPSTINTCEHQRCRTSRITWGKRTCSDCGEELPD